jgi:hypothetical protein
MRGPRLITGQSNRFRKLTERLWQWQDNKRPRLRHAFVMQTPLPIALLSWGTWMLSPLPARVRPESQLAFERARFVDANWPAPRRKVRQKRA